VSTSIGAYAYVWDVLDDPAFVDEIAGMGIDHLAVASAYHPVRATTHGPGRRIVSSHDSTVLFSPDPDRWRGMRLRPPAPPADGDRLSAVSEVLAQAGLPLHAWTVVAHNDTLARDHPDVSVENAFGDRYPWAVCISHDDVREYATTLVGEIAARPYLSGIELESCGWYGFDHLSAHDKIGIAYDDLGRQLLSLCFCTACRALLRDRGVDVDDARRRVRKGIDGSERGSAPAEGSLSDRLGAVLGPELAAELLAERRRTAEGFRRSVLAVARAERPTDFEILVDASPDPLQLGAFAGIGPDERDLGDGVVVNAWADVGTAAESVRRFRERMGADAAVLASLGIVEALLDGAAADGGRMQLLADTGVTGFRLYHGGLASRPDLDRARAMIGDYRSGSARSAAVRAAGVPTEISTASTRAVIGQVAAALLSLEVDGVECVETWDPAILAPAGAGTVLAPWPGRVAGGRWRDGEGTLQQLDLTDPAHGNAIHGLLRATALTPHRLSRSAVRMATTVYPQRGYPCTLEVSIDYRVTDDGLHVTHSFANRGTVPAPVGVGAHPYLRVRDAAVEGLRLDIAARRALVVDENMIPRSSVAAAEVGLDGRGLLVRDAPKDVVLAGFEPGRDGLLHHRLIDDATGAGVEVWAEPAFQWLQLFVVERFPSARGERTAIALEPMTCAPNAFNTGEGLVTLEPGTSWAASWGIRVLPD
jgi:galactose mutarotase-like enzyme